MTGEDLEKLIDERHECVLVEYFSELDVYSFRLIYFPDMNNWRNRFLIDSCNDCFSHKDYEYFPQFDDDFVYIISRKSIPLPLTPFMLHFANESAKDQKEIRQYQKEKAKNLE